MQGNEETEASKTRNGKNPAVQAPEIRMEEKG